MSKKVLFGLGAVVVAVAGVVIYNKVKKNKEEEELQEDIDEINDIINDSAKVMEDVLEAYGDEFDEEEDTEDTDEESVDFEEPVDFNDRIQKYYLQDLIDCIKDPEVKNDISNEYTNVCFDIEAETEDGAVMKPSDALKDLKDKIKEIIKNQ